MTKDSLNPSPLGIPPIQIGREPLLVLADSDSEMQRFESSRLKGFWSNVPTIQKIAPQRFRNISLIGRMSRLFLRRGHRLQRRDWLAGHVGLEPDRPRAI
jgi:hypothetical protein